MERGGAAAQGGCLGGIRNRLGAAVQVARAARGEADSCLRSRLEEAEKADPEREEQRESPPVRRAEPDQDSSACNTDRQTDDA